MRGKVPGCGRPDGYAGCCGYRRPKRLRPTHDLSRGDVRNDLHGADPVAIGHVVEAAVGIQSVLDDVYAGQAAKDDEQTNFECWFAYKRVEHRVRSPSVHSGAVERPKSTVGVDPHMGFAVDHVHDQPIGPDDERGALDRSDEREKAWGDPVRAGH